jgi:hypothetical protein
VNASSTQRQAERRADPASPNRLGGEGADGEGVDREGDRDARRAQSGAQARHDECSLYGGGPRVPVEVGERHGPEPAAPGERA